MASQKYIKMYSLDPEVETLLAKPVACALTGALVDRFWSGNSDISQNLVFGGCVAVGVLVSEVASKHLPAHDNGVTKSLESRLIEVGVSATGAIALDKFVFRTPMSIYTLHRIIGVVASDMAGEWVANSFLGIV
jgi:hypothetical protein